MAISQDKEELIEQIQASYQKLIKELQTSITEEQSHQKSMPGHAQKTYMSPHNLVSYLIGWGQLILKWHEEKIPKEKFPEEGFKWNELGELAQKFYSDYESLSYQELLVKYTKTVSKILERVEAEDNQTLYQNLWYKKHTMGRMIQFNTSSPYKNAYSRIRRWKKDQ